MWQRIILSFIVVCGLFIGPTAQAATFTENGTTTINKEIRDDAFLAGQNVNISAPVFGELFAAGSTVVVSERGDRSVYAAGNTVTIDKGAGYNAFAAGNTVTISGEYVHDVYVAGSTVIIKEGTIINGDLYVGAAELTLNGTVKGDVKASVDQMTSNAVVGGTLKGEINRLTFTGGSIGVDLSYGSDTDAKGLDQVMVAGKTERTKPKFESNDNEASVFLFLFFPFVIGAWLFSLLSSLILGALLIWLAPKKVTTVTENIRSNWKELFGRGVVAWIVIPVVSIFAFITLVGWPIGVIGLALYIPLLMFSCVIGSITVGTFLAESVNQKGNIWLALFLGVLVLAILTATPVIGWLLSLAVFIGLTLPALGGLMTWYKEHLNGK